MARDVLNSFSTAEIVVLAIGGMVVLTLTAVVLARRLFPKLADGEFEPVADSLRVVYELIFALILAFVIAAVLDEMGNAESTVASEATAISQLVRLNEAFPEKEKRRLDNAVEHYVLHVGTDEWKTMKDGDPSPRAAAALEGVYAEYRELTPRGDVQNENYSQALSKLDDVASARRERLNIAAADLPALLRVLVIVGLVLLLVLEYRPQLSRIPGLVFMGMLAAVVTASYLLTVILNYPFAGQISVANTPLKQDALAQFWADDLAYKGSRDSVKALTAEHFARVWNSDSFGTLAIRCGKPVAQRARPKCRPGEKQFHGVYRYNDGTFTGRISSDGAFRGWWTETPTRKARGDVGRVVWTLLQTPDGHLIVGDWSYAREKLQPGWDLHEIGGPEPPDLQRRFVNDEFLYAPRPR